MKIPAQLTFIESFYLTDGGTIVLIGEESNNSRHEVTLFQSLFLEEFEPKKIPGRLYFDQQLIAVRSEQETQVLRLLQAGVTIEDTPAPPNPAAFPNERPGMIVGDDLKDYFSKLAEGKNAVIRHLLDQMVARVESEDYLELALQLELKINQKN